MKKVFISYSSKDKWVREWLIPKLEEYGLDILADYKTFLVGKSSLENIETAIDNAHHTFFVITENWLSSQWTELENLIIQTQSPANRDLKFFVLRREECPLPKRLKPFTYLDLTDDATVEAQIRKLMEQMGITASSNSIPEFILTDRLPETSSRLFGREAELKLLDDVWENPQVEMVAFVAQGGEGKTALIHQWLRNLKVDGYRGAKRIYVWSFYSQGSAQDRMIPVAPFLNDALRAFGDAAMAESKASDEDKARRLAVLIRQSRTLLVLDGLEPLQFPPGPPHDGGLRDRAMKALLKSLAASNHGLCIVTTRIPILELDEFNGQGVIQQSLPHLTKEAGAKLLEELGVKPKKGELEKAAEEYHGHALALTLLGTLLAKYHHGDIRQRDRIPALTHGSKKGMHAERVLAYYSSIFEDQPELQVLRILGLFDRPAEPEAIVALQKAPAIAGITDRLLGIDAFGWTDILQNLRALHLLEAGDRLDCHPLIRAYFAQQLSQAHEAAFKEAHRRLYEHYQSIAQPFPDTTDEMEPLFRAMGHGCKAGLYLEAYDEVYRKRIQRGDQFFAARNLGAFSSDLAAIAGLFETPWRVVRGELRVGSRAFLLNEAGICLRALGRLREAVAPMEAGLEMRIAQVDRKNAAQSTTNLSELRLTIGEVEKAVYNGKTAVEYADKSEDLFRKLSDRATHADALHQAGAVAEAETIFREAEDLQMELQPAYPRLYSMRGYRFCDLLLRKGNWEEVKERAAYALEIAQSDNWLLDISLNKLSLGRAAHLEALATGSGDYAAAMAYLDQAVEGLKKAGRMDFLPKALLARAALYRDMQNYASAQDDLAEALEIADPEMRLFLADYHLESARLCLAMGGKLPEAQDHYAQAKKLVDEMGYRRRNGELEALKSQLKQ